MPRRRLGVVLLVPGTVADEVQGLRRACGDPMLDRVAPHLTLVPPVNVREEDLELGLSVLRAAARSVASSLSLTLGPVTSFLPVNPVLYLAVGGAGLDGVRSLREALRVEPFLRSVDHEFVPHVTLAAELDPDRIAGAVAGLADYSAAVSVDRIHVLEEQRDEASGERVWRPIADAALGPAAVVGRGGLEVELSVSERMDPEVAAWAKGQWDRVGSVSTGPATVVVTARRDGRPIGVVEGNIVDGVPRAERVLVGEEVRGEGVARHLLAWFATLGPS